MREQDDSTVGRQYWGLQELPAEEDGLAGTGLAGGGLNLVKTVRHRMRPSERKYQRST